VTAGQGARGGEQRREPKTDATWVWMPPGSFHYGCEPQDTQCEADKQSGRRESVDGFWMMQTEVTVAAYKKCVAAGACPADQLEGDSPEKTCNAPNGRTTHPMNCVNHDAAKAFCAYAGGRLPSAIEWEYAAKSGGSRIYPWGDSGVTARRANFCDRNCPRALNEAQQKQWRDNGWVTMTEDDGWAATAPVGSFAAGDSAWGLKDMS
jgi:formylglycine-generating enzyme required for sulfatase activity